MARAGQVLTLPVAEKALLDQVKELAQMTGWWFHHQTLSIFSAKGWPDVTLIKPPRMVLAELKTETGKVTPEQEECLALLRRVPGVEVYVWRPSDFEKIKAILYPPRPVP
jgi:hypothetical protein